MPRTAGTFSPRSYARIAGTLYLLIIAAGSWAEIFVRGRLVVAGDAAATARNIAAHPLLFRCGIAADLSTHSCAIAVAVILYALLKPAAPNAAALMLMFNLAQDAVGGMNALNTYRPLQLLGRTEYLKAFSPQQLEAMAMLSLNAHAVGFAIALLFFAFSCLALGYLIFASGLVPKALGLLMTAAGACYLVNSLARLLFPGWHRFSFPRSSFRHSSASYGLRCGSP